MTGSTREITSQPFALKRTSPCICGSGKRFKACCGSSQSDRQPPYGVMLRHGALATTECKELIAALEKKPRSWLNAGSRDTQSGSIEERLEDTRVTEQIHLGEFQAEINRLMGKLWTEVVAPAQAVEIEWFETPHILYYKEGGQFTSHADSEVFDPATELYYRVADRDLSMLVYLNSDFTGGQLHFSLFHYYYQPQAGDMVVFPSDHRYTHHAQKVNSGHRYSIVTWAKVKGSPQALPSPPENAIFVNR